jgi:TAG lipase / steryl ester hydrolase / phospholipase A2 / LPA acyltransferase
MGPGGQFMSNRLIRKRLNDLEQAQDYRAWLEIARDLDRLDGSDAWREDETSDDYDFLLIKERLAEMRRLRRRGDARQLAFQLHEGLHGNLGNMSNPALYGVARAGTKRLIEAYVAEVTRCLDFLCAGDFPGFSHDDKILFFKRTGTVFGRSALMLSGGATLGMFHLGVIKALWEEDLLPRVLSGSSAGAIIAAMAGVRTDAQMPEIFDADSLHLRAFQKVSLRRWVSDSAFMDAEALDACLQQNIGGETFEQAFERTRRIVGITASPAEPNQQGRLLNYLTAPNVLMQRAVLASCAIPGVFPPVMLEARDFQGRIRPYMPGKRWVDGSLSADLPMLRLARLHNVNHYIVSQTNPHVVPFLREGLPPTGVLPFARELMASSSRNALKLAHKHFEATGPLLSKLYGVVRQRYSGDINVFPRHTPRRLMRMLSNPSPDDIRRYIRDGERATWPRIERIRNQTRMSRTFEHCLQLLKTAGTPSRAPARTAERRLRAVS